MHTSEQEAIEQTEVGKWVYYGACGRSEDFLTFSVNIFQVIAKARKGKKKGKGIYRVSGSTNQPDLVYADAQAICEALNALPSTIKEADARRIARLTMDVRRAERKANHGR